jgi:DNA end-binding protein Ku
MPRALWSGSISFGLVHIPVKLVPAVRDKSLRFHLLHEKDGGQIRNRRVCSLDGKEVPADEIVKGYPTGGGRHVIVTEDELEGAQAEASRAIAIQAFVDLGEIEADHFDKPYHLVPDRDAGKPYGLLAEALRKTGKAAIATMVMHGREQLVALRPRGPLLGLVTLRFQDEMVPAEAAAAEAESQPAKPAKAELAMAVQLVEALAKPFDPAHYKDRHRERVLKMIEAKGEGKAPDTGHAPAASPATRDILEALRASIAEAEAHA